MEITGKIIAVLPEQGGVSKTEMNGKSRNMYWRHTTSIRKRSAFSYLAPTELRKQPSSQEKN